MKNNISFLKKFFTHPCFLFLSLLGLETFLIVYLALCHRIVLHDTFFRFAMQYYFLNNYIVSGEIPQWIPFLTQGTTASWWYIIQGTPDIFTNVLFLTKKLLLNSNFIDIFYLSMLFNKLFLAVGTWLLCKKYYYSNITCFFVSASVLATSIWTSQVYFNFLIYYSLPIIIYLLHKFIDHGKWKYCFLAFNFFFVQLIGSASYYIPTTTFVIFIYFFFYWICNQTETNNSLKKIQYKSGFFLFLISLLFFSYLTYYLLKTSFDINLFYNSPGRSIDGSVYTDVFSNILEHYSAFRWSELLTGVTPNRELGLYIGIFGVPMLLYCLLNNLNRKSLPILFVIIILFLYSVGTIVSKVIFYSWPLMKYARHFFLISGVTKVFLCFFAGFGFDAFIKDLSREKTSYEKNNYTIIFINIFLLTSAIGFFVLSQNPNLIISFSKLLNMHAPTKDPKVLNAFSIMIRFSSLKIFGTFLVFAFLLFTKKQDLRKGILPVIIILHIVDLYSYSFYEHKNKTTQLSPDQYSSLEFKSLPFNLRRNKKLWHEVKNAEILNTDLIRKSAHYWTINAFFFNDHIDTSLRTDFWQISLNEFINAYRGEPLDNGLKKSHGSGNNKLIFPTEHKAARLFSAIDANKIQFFSRAYFIQNKNVLAEKMRSPLYNGNILFVSNDTTEKNTASEISLLHSDQDLSLSQRLDIPFKTIRFDSNNLVIELNNTLQKNIWLFYSDAWHPRWKAFVNKNPSTIYKANLGYKALLLKPGNNLVEFKFFSKFLAGIFFIFSLNSLFWICFILRETGNICRDKPL